MLDDYAVSVEYCKEQRATDVALLYWFYTLLGGKSVEPFHFKYKIGTEIQLLYN